MIKNLDGADFQRWNEFVENSEQATFFHRAEWKEVIDRAFNHKTHYLYSEKNGEIDGILPLVHVNSLLFGNSLVSTPFCVYGGIVANDQQALADLDQQACQLAEELHVDYLEMRNLQPSNRADRQKKDLYVTFRKEMDPEVEKNLAAIPRKQRAMVRKGIKSGLISTIDQDIERFYRAYSESVRNLGTPVFSKKYFQILKEVFKQQCEILTIEKDGVLIGSVMSFFHKDTVLPYYGGGTDQARLVKGNDFMYWEVMRRAVEKGIKIFDYGRSKKGTGSYSFKKHWGFEPEPLHYEYHMVRADKLPDINPLNPKYQLFIAAWKKLPLTVSQAIGPWLSKDLG